MVLSQCTDVTKDKKKLKSRIKTWKPNFCGTQKKLYKMETKKINVEMSFVLWKIML